MKTYQWVLLTLSGFAALVLVIGASTLFGYFYSESSYQPEIIVKTVLVDNPVEVMVTKEVVVTKEVIVTATPVPTEVVQTTPTSEPLAVYPTEFACEDAAWVVMQPTSNLSTNGMKVGQIKRLHFQLRNEGTCTWDGYVLSSGGILPDIPVPYTMPGETADVLYDFQIYKPIIARWVLQPPMTAYGLSEPLMVQNSASPGVGLETIYYELEIMPDVKYPFGCGPYGCRSGSWRYK